MLMQAREVPDIVTSVHTGCAGHRRWSFVHVFKALSLLEQAVRPPRGLCAASFSDIEYNKQCNAVSGDTIRRPSWWPDSAPMADSGTPERDEWRKFGIAYFSLQIYQSLASNYSLAHFGFRLVLKVNLPVQCRTSKLATILSPTFGLRLGAKGKPIKVNDAERAEETIGQHHSYAS